MPEGSGSRESNPLKVDVQSSNDVGPVLTLEVDTRQPGPGTLWRPGETREVGGGNQLILAAAVSSKSYPGVLGRFFQLMNIVDVGKMEELCRR
ncbi:hypothetical protein RRG08_053180 [Elysia crispata]|uniref:Uncharacterized protein n=1 Tax=Elysia crispata TaxID=231223 RepID=A0AAE0YR08_9GAST|nr:hypothetical protein RRG08_053180 [Elysia crispata]